MKHLDLFSGIGGFALAADKIFNEVEHIFCEIDPFCQEVLNKHWPESKIYEDIRTLTNTDRSGNRTPKCNTNSEQSKTGKKWKQSQSEFGGQIDILTGGFPCQPFSQAGKRKGKEDNRYLWPEMFRVIREFKPIWVIAENVRGLLTINNGMVFEQVCLDLESAGYEVQPFIIPAVAVNAPHRRDRVWIIAHGNDSGGGAPTGEAEQEGEANSSQREYSQHRISRQGGNASDTESVNEKRWRKGQGKMQFRRSGWANNWLEVATRLCRVDDGLPRRLDRNPRLKSLGNAIVPQVAEEIFKAIKLTFHD